MVTAITGNRISERIPDSVFDNADQVKLVDIEPQELLERLSYEKVQILLKQTVLPLAWKH